MNEVELITGYTPSPAGSGSTARRIAVDLSREAARASGTYPAWDGTVPRVEPCACGGFIQAYTPRHIPVAVQTHNATKQHQAWRQDMDL